MIKGISHISLSSKNLKKVIDFYVKFLGFKVAQKFINKNNQLYGVFIYCGNKTFIEFFKSKEKFDIKKSKFRHLCFEVKNFSQFLKKIKKKFKNVRVNRGKTDNILQFFIKDFEGNIIEFHYHDNKSKLKKFLKK